MTFSDFRGLALMRENNILVHNPAYSSLYVKWVFRRNRGQVYQGMLYYRPFELMALKRFGVLSANPWVMGAGHSDIVCVDSRATGDRYLGYGVPEAKLRIVGDTAFDGLHQAYLARDGLRRSLIREYALDPEKKNIIVSLPNLAEHDLLPWDAHFREIDFLMAALKGTGGNILVSLHPKMDPSKYAYLEGEFGCRILTQRLAQALPAGDLFVATFSSTVVWAVLCGIRAVVVDFYGLDSDMFDFLKSVSIVTRRDDLSATLEQALLTAPDFSEDWRKLSREEVFDGRTLQRYLRLIPSKDGMLT
jgi:hypothetical protein